MIEVDFSDVERADPRAVTDSELDAAYIEVLAEKATRLLYQLVPAIDARIATGVLNEDLVKDKIIEAVLRVVRNPDPVYSQETELGYSYTINKRLASGDLWFPENDLALLRGPRVRFGTVPIGLGPGWCRP